MNCSIKRVFLGLVVLALTGHVYAQVSLSEVPQGLTVQGRIIQPDGLPLEDSHVSFNIKVLSPGAESCVLFEENRVVNMNNSKGVINFVLGSGEAGASVVNVGHSLPIHKILKNSGTLTGLTKCAAGYNTYTAQAGDSRKVRVSFTVGSETVALSPDFNIRSVPYAMESENATSLEGKKAADFLLKSNNITQDRAEQLFLPANFDGLLSLLNPSASAPSTGAIGIPSSDGTATTPARDGLMRYDEATQTVQVSIGGQWQDVATGNTTVGSSNIESGSIETSHIANSSVTGAKVVDNAITTSKLADEAVTSDKIMNSSVTNSKIADGAITFNKIANGAISTVKIVDSAITTVKILDSAVTTAKIADGNVTDAKIASVSGAKITGNIPGEASGFYGALNGDVTGGQSSTVVQRIQNRNVANVNPGVGQVLKWDGGQWVPQADNNSGGTITGVVPSTGLTGGGYSGNVSLGLTNTGVPAGWYGNGSYIPQFYVDAQGRITAVNNVAVSATGVACGGTPHGKIYATSSGGCSSTTTLYQCFNGAASAFYSYTSGSCDGDGF